MSVIAWYDTDWQHRKTVSVSNDTGSTLSNEDVLVTVDTADLISQGKLQSDCGDLRFVDSDDSTVLDYWIEAGCNTTTTEVWVQVPSLPSAGKTIYMYYDNSTIENGGLTWSGGNYLILSSQTSCPTGWSRVTALDDRLIRGASTYGSTGGNLTHTHTYDEMPSHLHSSGSLVTNTTGAHIHQIKYSQYPSGTGTYISGISTGGDWSSTAVASAGDHTHTITGSTGSTGVASSTTSSGSNLPPYLTMLLCVADDPNISVVPQNSIFLFETLPASGYTRYTALDDRFPMASDTPGTTGGSEFHTHTYTDVIAHTHGVGSLVTSTAGAHTHSLRYRSGVSGTTPYIDGTTNAGDWVSGSLNTTGAHTHTISGSVASTGVAVATTEQGVSMPPYVDMIYATQDSNEQSFLSGTIVITRVNPPLGWSRYDSLDSNFPRGASTLGETGGTATHNHVYDEIPAHTHDSGTLTTSSAGDHTHNVRRSTAPSGYLPYPVMESNSYAWGGSTSNMSSSGDHSHTISGNTALAGPAYTTTSTENNLPPYTEVVFSQRKDSQTTVLGAEDSPVPNAPSMPGASAISTTEINWYFTDNSTDELGFKVYDENDVLKVTCDTPDISSCLETGLSENTEYTRKIVAYNTFGDSQFSDPISAYTKAGSIDITDIESTVDSVTMTSSTFANPTTGLSGYYFDCTGECHTGINEWLQTNSDQATGLENNSTYKFTVKNRNGNGVENPYPMSHQIWTKAAIPTISNTDVTDTTITLEGAGVNYLDQGSSGLYFDCIAGESCDNGINEWVSTSTDIVIGLSPDSQYEFKVKARNFDGIETEYSNNSVLLYTGSTQPTISSVDNPTITTLDVTVDNQANPSTTLYAIEEVNTATYVGVSGLLVVDPVWLTYTQLGEETGITVSGLESNTEYSFRVKAKNQSDVETEYSDPVSAYTQLTAPTALTPTTKTENSITWKLSTSESDYSGIKVYDTNENLVTTCVGSDITECQENGLNPNTEYSRKLTIYSTQSESAFSSAISESTYAQPVSISMAVPFEEYYQVSLTINLGDNPIGTNLQIFEETTSRYVKETIGDLNILVETEEVIQSDGDDIVITALLPNTQYTFKVRALDEDDNPTSWSSSVNVRTYAKTPIISLTQSLSTTSGRIKIDLKENPASTRVSVIESGGLYLTEEGLLSETEDLFIPPENGIEITGLDPNTTYTFQTRGFNEDNVETQWSSPLAFTTYIEQPTIEITNQTENSITLTFSGLSNLEEGDSGIYVEDIGTWSKNLTQTVTGLNPNTSYTFNVKTRNSNGLESEYISSSSGYTLAQIPSISSAIPTSTTSGTLTIDLGSNPEDTKISIKETTTDKYLTSQGAFSTEETILDTDNLIFNVNGLSANTTYTFKIKAYNEDNLETEYSENGVNLTTFIQNPVISIDNVTSSSANVIVSGLNNTPSGNSGILVERINSWSKNLTQTVSNLNANTSYTFRVKARNINGLETSYISSTEVQTLADIPTVASVRKLSANTARVYLGTNGNPSYTQFAIRDRISGEYINASGALQTDPVWQTYSQWGGGLGKYVSGLDGLRQIGFEVKARNNENIETGFSEAKYIGTGSILKNIPNTVSVNLKSDEAVDLTTDAQLGIQDVRVKKDQYVLADFKVSFEQDRDWKNVVADADTINSKSVIKITDEEGISDPFTMYVVKNDTNAFRLCPLATSLDDVNNECTGGQLLTKDFPQEIEIEGSTVTISLAKIDGTYYWIADGLTGTGGMGESIEVEQEFSEGDEYEQEPTETATVVSDVIEKVNNVVNKVSQNIVLGTTEVLDNTPIADLNQEELSTAVATTTTVTITVGVATTGFTQIFYLIFHFFNGFFNALGFRRKKKPFGFVYDSSNKEPISNAVVRIYKGNELLETTVTNSAGMFLSNLDKGEYRVEVKKGGYMFPSKLVKGKEDYPLKNIYKGELLKKTESSDLLINIPLDKKTLDSGKKILTILKSVGSIILTIANVLLFGFGILLLIYTYYKHPDSFKWYIPILYIPALYFLTKSIFSKTAVYGKILDKDGNPISNKEIYLVNKEFNEVVAKRVTDENGKYRFVCQKGEYDLKVGDRILLSNIKVKKDGYVLAKRILLN
jgi:hypothetical protein